MAAIFLLKPGRKIVAEFDEQRQALYDLYNLKRVAITGMRPGGTHG